MKTKERKENMEKGRFLREFYGGEIEKLKDEEGKATAYARAAQYWGEPIPETEEDVERLRFKGKALEATENFSTPQKFGYNSLFSGRQHLSLLRNNQIKVPFVKTGSWKHNVYGEVKFTDEDVNQLVSNYKDNSIGFVPYLTLGHLDEEPNSTDSHRKRGDLKDVIVEEDEDGTKVGYGIFDVNDDIYASIKRGEYEYSSGEFDRNLRKRETGEEAGTAVLRVALTNSPFLPFGDKKIQLLSETAGENPESCPESRENHVFSLSVYMPDNKAPESTISTEELIAEDSSDVDQSSNVAVENSNSNSDNVDNTNSNSDNVDNTLNSSINTTNNTTNKDNKKEDINMENMEIEKGKEKEKEVVLTDGVESTKEETAEKVETEVASTKPEELTVKEAMEKEEVKVESSKLEKEELSKIFTQLEKVEQLYKSQLEKANKVIDSLSDKVEALTGKLEGQSKVTQAFSSSMDKAREKALVSYLESHNVTPALVQQFLSFKKGLTKDNTVKLSATVGDESQVVEKEVAEVVANMLISACSQGPVVQQQLGISSNRKTGPFDFSSIIERNKQAATKERI